MNRRLISTNAKDILITTSEKEPNSVNPWFLTGLTDAEGSFIVIITKNPKYKTGYRVIVRFQIGLHEKDLELLKDVQSYFGGNEKLVERSDKVVVYQVQNLDIITNNIIPHFDKYPLTTKKREDFHLFKLVVDIINKGDHLNPEGLQDIINIKSSLNLGLSDELKVAFPNSTPVERDLNLVQIEVPDPYWLSGFSTGEGCFSVHTRKSSASKLGFSISLSFQLDQHSRDSELMENLIIYFNCGQVTKNGSCTKFYVTKFSDIINVIIPFFTNHPILGNKAKDFSNFCQISELIKNKEHLNPDGFAQIFKIKGSMNKNRVQSKEELRTRVSTEPSAHKVLPPEQVPSPLYIYNRDMTILYHSTENEKEYVDYLKINKYTFCKHLMKGSFYLGKYLFSREHSSKILKFKNLSLLELKLMLDKDREQIRRKKS